MTGKGTIAKQPASRIRLTLVILTVWHVLVCVLAIWWGSLLMKQSQQISDLQSQLGVALDVSQMQLRKTQRMLLWESSTFFVLLIGSTMWVSWIYLRDLKRGKSLQSFFASFTHELRTPLSSIRLQAESISDALTRLPSKSENVQNLIDRLLQDTSRLESQVERTLELARVEGGGPIFLRTLPVLAWIEKMKLYGQEHYGKFIQMDWSVSLAEENDPVLIEADPNAMNVIFKNIFENAVKHGQSFNEREKRASLKFVVRRAHDAVLFGIQDNGKNFSGDASRLGELFFKGENSQGAGVGLYLVNVLMKRMGGAARFQPKSDGFFVELEFKEALPHA